MLNISRFNQFVIVIICALGVLFAMPNLFYSRVETSNDAEKLIAEGIETPEVVADAEKWPGFLPDSLVNLGLDLRGGAQLLAEVQVEQVHDRVIDAMWPPMRDALAVERDLLGPVTREESAPNELRIRIRNSDQIEEAVRIVREQSRPVASVTAGGASNIEVRTDGTDIFVTLSEAEIAALDERTVNQSLEIIRRRIDAAGTREPAIQRQGEDRILIQVPGAKSAQELKDWIGTTAQLTFNPVVSATADGTANPGFGNVIYPDVTVEGRFYVLEQTPVVTGEDLVDAQPDFDQNGNPAVSFRFNVSGAKAFGDYTAQNIGSPFAIVLDEEVISAPTIQAHIAGGSGIITGNFSIEETTNLAVLLRAGALPAELDFLEERTIGPELGQDSIDAGRLAAVVGLAAVMIFMLLTYSRFGAYADVALFFNMALILAILSVLTATLTLPGIAGIVLTIGMAVDANVLVYERIREESRSAKGPARAIELGYGRAMSAIVDANITTFMTAAILWFVGAGPVRGFATTLGIGILTSVFAALFVSRLLIVWWFQRTRPKTLVVGNPRFRLVPEGTKIDFFKHARVTLGVSLVAVIASIAIFFTMGLNYGIDFRGGTTIRTQSEQPVDIAAYRDAITPLGLGDVSIVEVFDPTFDENQHVANVRIEAQEGQESIANETVASVQTALQTVDPSMTFPSVESVGPKVSGELVNKAIIAVTLSLLAIMAYIWLRFEWQFAIGALAALVHDVALTIGIFSLFQIKFDLAIIAGLLTIVGYSINDTVVVFDRARENLIKYTKMPLREVFNISTNETLSRTVMTSFTTLVALIALLVLGGDVIRGIVFSITFGVIVGTYSSIYVAKNVVLMLGVKRDWSKEKKPTGNQFMDVDA